MAEDPIDHSLIETPSFTIVPVHGKDGNLQLYDMYVDGIWHGSRSTLAQCALYFSQL